MQYRRRRSGRELPLIRGQLPSARYAACLSGVVSGPSVMRTSKPVGGLPALVCRYSPRSSRHLRKRRGGVPDRRVAARPAPALNVQRSPAVAAMPPTLGGSRR